MQIVQAIVNRVGDDCEKEVELDAGIDLSEVAQISEPVTHYNTHCVRFNTGMLRSNRDGGLQWKN
jgi:hypothetical protein